MTATPLASLRTGPQGLEVGGPAFGLEAFAFGGWRFEVGGAAQRALRQRKKQRAESMGYRV
jgi:hypothetical protein